MVSNHRCGLRLTATGLFKKCVFHPHIRHFYMGSPRAWSFLRNVVFGNLGSDLNARIKKTIRAKMERPAMCAMLWQVNQTSKPSIACWNRCLQNVATCPFFTQNFITSWTTSRTLGSSEAAHAGQLQLYVSRVVQRSLARSCKCSGCGNLPVRMTCV